MTSWGKTERSPDLASEGLRQPSLILGTRPAAALVAAMTADGVLTLNVVAGPVVTHELGSDLRIFL
jgi:hypothetical protein